MRVKSEILRNMHLDRSYCLLPVKNVKILLEIFRVLDIRENGALDDLQFWEFMHAFTDLSKSNIYNVFDMLDVDGSGTIDFDEFYLLMCILIAIKDKQEKHFIFRHSRTVFDLLDQDGSNNISADEFQHFGFLFNFEGAAVKGIFNEFDVSGDQELDYKEFKMFAMACIDRQMELEKQKKEKEEEKKMNVEMKEKKKILKEMRGRGILPPFVSKEDVQYVHGARGFCVIL